MGAKCEEIGPDSTQLDQNPKNGQNKPKNINVLNYKMVH